MQFIMIRGGSCVVVALAIVTWAGRASATDLYVSPAGSDSLSCGGGVAIACKTVDQARKNMQAHNANMAADNHVYLLDGTYYLDATLTFSPKDSGTNGHSIVYSAYPGASPVLSGGSPVTGAWVPVNGTSYYAISNSSLDGLKNGTRDLFVNGERQPLASCATAGWTVPVPGSGSGYTQKVPPPAGACPKIDSNWSHFTDIVVADTFAGWRVGRGPVIGFASSGPGNVDDIVTMEPHYWAAVNVTQWNPGCCHLKGVNDPITLENHLRFLDSPREWYLDVWTSPHPTLYYMPRAGVTAAQLSKSSVVAGRVLPLVSRDASSGRVHHIQFVGLTFAHSTWVPGPTGFAHWQASTFMTDMRASSAPTGSWNCDDVPDPQARAQCHCDAGELPASPFVCNGTTGVWHPWDIAFDGIGVVPASLSWKHVSNIRFAHCSFVHLGGAALAFGRGSQHNEVASSVFNDIADAGIIIGEPGVHHEGTLSPQGTLSPDFITDNLIHDNLLSFTGRIHSGSVPIFQLYADHTVISHNEIHDAPYSGISVGWGWGAWDADNRLLADWTNGPAWGMRWRGYPKPSDNNNVQIVDNLLYSNMRGNNGDGGDIYLNGRFSGVTQVANNVVNVVKDQQGSGHISYYADDGTGNVVWNHNVCDGASGFALFKNRNKPPAFTIGNTVDVPGVAQNWFYQYSIDYMNKTYATMWNCRSSNQMPPYLNAPTCPLISSWPAIAGYDDVPQDRRLQVGRTWGLDPQTVGGDFMTGLKLWLRSDTGLTCAGRVPCTGGATVTKWANQASEAGCHDAVPYGGTVVPYHATQPPYAYDGVTINPSNSLASACDSVNMAAQTVFVVMTPRTVSDLGQQTGAGWGTFLMHTMAAGGIYAGIDANNRFTPQDCPGIVLRPGVPTLLSFSWSAADNSAELVQDGGAPCRKQFGSSPLPMSHFSLGYSFTGNGDTTEILLYNRRLNDFERGRIERYLRDKVRFTSSIRDFAIAANGQLWVVDGSGTFRTTSDRLHSQTNTGVYLDIEPNGSGKAIAATSDVVYVIGNDDHVWRGTPTAWVQTSQTALRLTVDPSTDKPWVIGLDNAVHSFDASTMTWSAEAPTTARGKDIAIADGTPYIIDMLDHPRKRVGGTFVVLSSTATLKRLAIDGSSGTLWGIGMNDHAYSSPTGKDWTEYSQNSAGKDIRVYGGRPYLRDMNDHLLLGTGSSFAAVTVLQP